MPTYPLWAHFVFVSDARAVLVVTRARSQTEAHDYMRRSYGDWVCAVASYDMPINAAEVYSDNHAPGWLERPPVWLARERKV
jgi:hypothetical protein